MAIHLSFIVPFHRGLRDLARCLNALDPLPPRSELIIAADAAVEDCSMLAAAHGARLIEVAGRSGPAAARNAAAAAAIGEVLVFVDADVVVSHSGLARLGPTFEDHPQTAAVFGAYDEHPGDPGFMSQYKNLSHSYIHQSAATTARTFWAGFGAVRRTAFQLVGGFDERFDRPSVEDIDLGYRLTQAGFAIRLDPTLSACHLKRWTIRSTILSDVRDRGIPWTQLILRYGVKSDHLNLRSEYRWSIAVAYFALLSLMGAWWYDPRFVAIIPLLMVALTILNHRYYRFFYRKRGASFAARAWVLHVLHHLYNGMSFTYGTGAFFAARVLGLRLPGALSLDAWSRTHSQSTLAARIGRLV